MRRVSLVLGLLLFVLVSARADGPDDLYLQIYSSLQKADALNERGQYRAASDKYVEVEEALNKFQRSYPNWNAKIISYRQSYVSERIQALEKFLAPPEPAPQANFAVSSKTGGSAAEAEAQIKLLANEIRRLESERANLEGKLREALSVKQTSDPSQLEEAQARIAALEKERDLLKVALDQAKAAQQEVASPADARTVRQLERERDELQRKLDSALKQQALSESRYQNEIKASKEKLAELELLDSKRAEVEKQLRAALEEANRAANGKISRSDLKRLKKLEEEKADLEKRFDDSSKELAALQNQREQEILAYKSALRRIKELEHDKEALQKQLAGVDTVSPEEKNQLVRENLQLRSRLEAYEARPTPFTPEELALFKKPDEPSLPKSFVVSTKMTKELPAKARTLVAEADKAFTEAKFEEAEKKYEQVLNQNDKNVYALANLASVKLELNRLTEAEEALNKALSVDANDAFSLLLRGKLKLSQGQFDEALDALSRSAQLNPQSAETQNYLGIVLSEKGQRVSAEAALRKAIQIQPDYASAHHNLSIIYATQKPPFLELARWHYDKAVALGHAHNADLEKLIAGK